MNLKEFSDGLRDSERLEAENAELRARLQSVTAGHAKDLDVLAERAEAENLQWRQAHEDLQAIMRTQAEQSAATCRDLLRRAERAEAQMAVLRECVEEYQGFLEFEIWKRKEGRTERYLNEAAALEDVNNALANTDGGKGLLEIVRCAEKYVERYRGCGGSNGLFSEMETIVDAYHAQQGGETAKTSSHDGEEV
jgi:hypothetical protein